MEGEASRGPAALRSGPSAPLMCLLLVIPWLLSLRLACGQHTAGSSCCCCYCKCQLASERAPDSQAERGDQVVRSGPPCFYSASALCQIRTVRYVKRLSTSNRMHTWQRSVRASLGLFREVERSSPSHLFRKNTVHQKSRIMSSSCCGAEP